jgi:hypothetical protein
MNDISYSYSKCVIILRSIYYCGFDQKNQDIINEVLQAKPIINGGLYNKYLY